MDVDFTHANIDFLPHHCPREHLFKRVYLGALYPRFREAFVQTILTCAARGTDYVVTFGFRSYSHQLQLHQAFLNGTGGRAAPAGLSAHQYGLACDSVKDSNKLTKGLQPDWSAEAYAMLGEESIRNGLVWGASFNDMPHVQWPGFVNGKELATLKRIWQSMPPRTPDNVRLTEIWKYLDTAKAPKKD